MAEEMNKMQKALGLIYAQNKIQLIWNIVLNLYNVKVGISVLFLVFWL